MARQRDRDEVRAQQASRIEVPGWPEDPAGWLKARGWVYLRPEDRPSPRKCWQDCPAGKPTEVKVGEKKVRDTMPGVPVYQTRVPAGTWCYATEEAVEIQLERERDRAKG